MLRNYFFLIFFVVASFACNPDSKGKFTSQPIQHKLWTHILERYVDENGLVDYKGLLNDSTEFYQYLDLLSTHHPNDKYWSKDQKMAYWLNAYNAFTIRLIIDSYPVESIKKIKVIEIPFLHSIWNKPFIHIESSVYSLNDIEHDILRKEFNDPRIHFAINCASISCPSLSQKAFDSEKIDQQLSDRAILFLSDISKNDFTNKTISLSRIFKWFKADFTKKGSVIMFINQFRNEKIPLDTSIGYMDYNWDINEQ